MRRSPGWSMTSRRGVHRLLVTSSRSFPKRTKTTALWTSLRQQTSPPSVWCHCRLRPMWRRVIPETFSVSVQKLEITRFILAEATRRPLAHSRKTKVKHIRKKHNHGAAILWPTAAFAVPIATLGRDSVVCKMLPQHVFSSLRPEVFSACFVVFAFWVYP